MYRDPITNRFVAGDPPTVGQDGVGVPGIPEQQAPAVPPRGGDIHGGWDYVPTVGQESGGNLVESVEDTLSQPSASTDEAVIGGQSQSPQSDYGPKHCDDNPVVTGRRG